MSEMPKDQQEILAKLSQGIEMTQQQFVGSMATWYDRIITPFKKIIEAMGAEIKQLKEENAALRKQLGMKPPVKGNRKQRRAAKHAKTS